MGIQNLLEVFVTNYLEYYSKLEISESSVSMKSVLKSICILKHLESLEIRLLCL